VKTNVWSVVALALAVALGTCALAGEKKERKERPKPQTTAGTLTGGAVAGETVTWKVAAEDGAAKEVPMATNVVVIYSDKNGQSRAQMIRVAGKKTPAAKGNRLVATGTLKAVAVEGRKATVTVTVEGEDKEFALGTKVKIMAREKNDGTVQAMMLSAAGGGGRKKKDAGDQPAEGKKKRKEKGGDEAPENL
jgi:hypothetical protein